MNQQKLTEDNFVVAPGQFRIMICHDSEDLNS